jgi:hypothetical protein
MRSINVRNCTEAGKIYECNGGNALRNSASGSCLSSPRVKPIAHSFAISNLTVEAPGRRGSKMPVHEEAATGNQIRTDPPRDLSRLARARDFGDGLWRPVAGLLRAPVYALQVGPIASYRCSVPRVDHCCGFLGAHPIIANSC